MVTMATFSTRCFDWRSKDAVFTLYSIHRSVKNLSAIYMFIVLLCLPLLWHMHVNWKVRVKYLVMSAMS